MPTATADDVQPAESVRIVFRGARVIDGTGAPPRVADVVVKDGRIEAVGSRVVLSSLAHEVDLSGATLLPGFIDTHVHITASPTSSPEAAVLDPWVTSEADQALRGAGNARATLEAGFTTVRSVGGSLADRALRDAIAAGHVVGPRMLVANYAIGITGGHCDEGNGLQPELFETVADYRRGVADGPDEVRKAVRYQIKHGADVIKLCASGGVLSTGDRVGAPQMTAAELQTAVDEAKRAGLKVAAHAHGRESIEQAVLAGVDSIEHGSRLDEELARLMRQQGTVLVPTLFVASHVEHQARQGAFDAEAQAKIDVIAPAMRRSFRLALTHGVEIALGSDAGVFEHGTNAMEFVAMVEHGLAEMDAIVAGTSAGADLLGLSGVGRIREGFVADLVVVTGDPLDDIRELEHPILVMKAGEVYLDRRALLAQAR